MEPDNLLERTIRKAAEEALREIEEVERDRQAKDDNSVLNAFLETEAQLDQEEYDRQLQRDQDDQARDDREASARASTLKRKKTKAKTPEQEIEIEQEIEQEIEENRGDLDKAELDLYVTNQRVQEEPPEPERDDRTGLEKWGEQKRNEFEYGEIQSGATLRTARDKLAEIRTEHGISERTEGLEPIADKGIER